MPSKTHIGTGQIFEGTNAVIMHRLNLPDGTAVATGNTTGINVTLNVYEVGHPTRGDVASSTQSLTRTAVIIAMATDGYWDVDGTGYNFKHVAAYGTANSSSAVNYRGGRKYRHEYEVLSDSFGIIRWVTVLEVIALSAI